MKLTAEEADKSLEQQEAEQRKLIAEWAKNDPRIMEALRALDEEARSGVPTISIEDLPSEEYGTGGEGEDEEEAEQHIGEWFKVEPAHVLAALLLVRAVHRSSLKRQASSPEHVLPIQAIVALAQEAIRYIKMDKVIAWSAIEDAIGKLEDEQKVIQLASSIFGKMEAADLLAYHNIRSSIAFVIQAALERKGYEWNTKTASWEQ